MDERLGTLERRVEELSRAVADLQARVRAVEDRGPGGVLASRPAAHAGGIVLSAGRPADDNEVAAILGLVGRVCLVLGGAYLLRAFTDGGTLPRPIGTLLGIGYAVAWLVMAHRQAGGAVAGSRLRRDAASAAEADAAGSDAGPTARSRLAPAFYGAAAALIAFPLLWEATIRFHLLGPAAAALSMTGVTLLGLAVAWHRRLQGLAWITTTAGLLAAPLFMLALGPAVPFGFYLTFLGIATLWMGYSLDWIWLRWPVAFVLDLTVAVMAGSVTSAWRHEGASAVMLLQLTLFGAYLVSIAARTIWRSRDVIPFEVVQMLALLVVAFGGAAYVMSSTGSGAWGLGVASLAFGIGSYGVAFAFVDWRLGHWKNFVFYTSLGLVFVLAGTSLTMEATWRGLAWAAVAPAAAWLAYRHAAIALWPHAAIYLLSAASSCGLLASVSDAFLASAAAPWALLGWPALVVLAASAACSGVPVPAVTPPFRPYARLPKLAVALCLLLGAGALVITLALALFPAAGGDGGEAIVAAVRTFVLAAAALLLAWLGGRGLFGEGRWLTYVVLVAGGLKLLVSDLVHGRPSTLVASLVLYGAALIIAPKWARRSRSEPVGPAQAPAA